MEHKIYRMYTDIDSGYVGMLNPRSKYAGDKHWCHY